MEQLIIRPYRSSDCEKIRSWITDEESHLKWCAGALPFGFSAKEFDRCLLEGQKEWGDRGFTATDEKDEPVGFFKLNVNQETKAGFFKCIIVDGSLRGMGLGKRMLTKAVKYAFEEEQARKVRLIVFDDNAAAVSCYAKVGFRPETVLEPLEQNGKKWGRTKLVIEKE